MPDNASQDQTLDRLARRILEGDVVFFIGAGFSIDSEGNTARRLMRRLVLRLLAFDEAGVPFASSLFEDFLLKFNLDPKNFLSGAHDTREARVRWLTLGGLSPTPEDEEKLDGLHNEVYAVGPYLETLALNTTTRTVLRRLFNVLGEWPINRLARDYYEVNEWFCLAFQTLLQNIASSRSRRRAQLECIHTIEERLRIAMNGLLPAHEAEDFPLARIEEWLLPRSDGRALDPRIAGKALFLETLGFADGRVMSGDLDSGFDATVSSFRDRLLPRHHVLARFAREGWCPTLITTNFDLLLEGSYRLAGFGGSEKCAARDPRDPDFPDTLISSYDVVASPLEFFRKAKAYRTTVVVKIHGCARRYRNLAAQLRAALAKRGGGPRDYSQARAELEECVRGLVFTYREIQHWRNDNWAADFLRTILRTRTVVFCGYSVRDPVIHDTFRGAFEEMARHGAPSPGAVGSAPAGALPPAAGTSHEPRPPADSSKDAPLFLMASTNERPFHGEAVLRAASEAVGGCSPPHEPHRNLVRFNFRGGAFPDLDEVMRWLQHLTWRRRQVECVDNFAARSGALLAGDGSFQQKPRREIDRIRRKLEDLVSSDVADGPFTAASSDAARRQFELATGWTEMFHVGLLREFACADDTRRRYPKLDAESLRRHEWYFPAMENAVWTCWAVIVELALRTLADILDQELRTAECTRPTVLFGGTTAGTRTPWALTIEFHGTERAASAPRVVGAPARRVVWELQPHDVPWPFGPPSSAASPSPGARHRGSSFSAHASAPPGSLVWQLAAWDGAPASASRLRQSLASYVP